MASNGQMALRQVFCFTSNSPFVERPSTSLSRPWSQGGVSDCCAGGGGFCLPSVPKFLPSGPWPFDLAPICLLGMQPISEI